MKKNKTTEQKEASEDSPPTDLKKTGPRLLFSQNGGSLLQLRSHWQVRVSLPTMS